MFWKDITSDSVIVSGSPRACYGLGINRNSNAYPVLVNYIRCEDKFLLSEHSRSRISAQNTRGTIDMMATVANIY